MHGRSLPDPPDPSAGASAAAHHRALLGQAGQGGGDVPLADLLGPLGPIESRPANKWRRGAEGERRTAQLLAPLRHLGWRVLHDRRIPGSAANVDHLVIGSSGVWVVDSKAWRGRVKVLGDGRLWYGRRCLDGDLRVLCWEASEIGRALGGQGQTGEPLPIHPVLCIHGARLPREQLRFDDVTLVSPKVLVDMLTSAAPCLTEGELERLATRATNSVPGKASPQRKRRPSDARPGPRVSSSSIAAAMICESIPNGAPCRHPARYRVALEEEGPDETSVIATRDACADDLAAAVDWALTRPTPYAGEAQDVYLTLHERRISVVSLSSDG